MAEMAAMGIRSPVDEKTWLRLMTLVRFPMPFRIRAQIAPASLSSGEKDTVSIATPWYSADLAGRGAAALPATVAANLPRNALRSPPLDDIH
jgi:hypothetical protein